MFKRNINSPDNTCLQVALAALSFDEADRYSWKRDRRQGLMETAGENYDFMFFQDRLIFFKQGGILFCGNKPQKGAIDNATPAWSP